MNIAQVAPLTEPVPPDTYGGTERIVSYLTEELVCQGHHVTLFACADSVTSAELVPCAERPLRSETDATPAWALVHSLLQIEEVSRRAHEFDIIHFHMDYLHSALSRHKGWNTLTTLHGRLDLPEVTRFYREFNEQPLVSISNSQRRPMPPVNWAGTVYHGLPDDLYAYHGAPDDYVVFLGRFAPEKRPDRAIEIARRAGIKLKLAAKVDRVDELYFNEEIRPLLVGPYAEYIGEIGDVEKKDLLSRARALLFPIDWPEPFGLVMIEAMACGTPVVAYRCGSVPEVIEEGVSGYIVDSVEDAVTALKKIDAIPRAGVRTEFERRFSAQRMASNYVEIYRKLTGAAKKRRDSPVKNSVHRSAAAPKDPAAAAQPARHSE